VRVRRRLRPPVAAREREREPEPEPAAERCVQDLAGIGDLLDQAVRLVHLEEGGGLAAERTIAIRGEAEPRLRRAGQAPSGAVSARQNLETRVHGGERRPRLTALAHAQLEHTEPGTPAPPDGPADEQRLAPGDPGADLVLAPIGGGDPLDGRVGPGGAGGGEEEAGVAAPGVDLGAHRRAQAYM